MNPTAKIPGAYASRNPLTVEGVKAFLRARASREHGARVRALTNTAAVAPLDYAARA